MKKRPNRTAQHAPRALHAHELQTIRGGDGGGPGLDIGQIQQMQEQSFQQQ